MSLLPVVLKLFLNSKFLQKLVFLGSEKSWKSQESLQENSLPSSTQDNSKEIITTNLNKNVKFSLHFFPDVSILPGMNSQIALSATGNQFFDDIIYHL